MSACSPCLRVLTVATVVALLGNAPTLHAAPFRMTPSVHARMDNGAIANEQRFEPSEQTEQGQAGDADGAATTSTVGLDSTEALNQGAIEAFQAKDYDRAIDLFRQAYDQDPQPNYLFNIGRVFEEKGHIEQAVSYYQDFVKQPGVELEAREIAVSRLKVLREALTALAPEETPQQPVHAPATTPPQDPKVSARRHHMKIAGASLLGIGGAGLAMGTVFGVLAINKSKGSKNAELVDDRLSLREQAKARAAVADGLIISSAVVAATGLGLLIAALVPRRKSGRAAADTARISPVISPDHAGLQWSGHF